MLARELLTSGLSLLLTQHGEACVCSGVEFTGLLRIETRDFPDGRGTYTESTLLCNRSSFTALPTTGEAVDVGGIEYRLTAIRSGELSGTIRLQLEEEIR
jgi:hypothetical protein